MDCCHMRKYENVQEVCLLLLVTVNTCLFLLKENSKALFSVKGDCLHKSYMLHKSTPVSVGVNLNLLKPTDLLSQPLLMAHDC